MYGRVKVSERACADENTLIGDLKSTRATVKQSASLALGRIRYERCAGAVEFAGDALLGLLEVGTKVGVSI
jgi:hypothetical protein